jgi:hypothetical protein
LSETKEKAEVILIVIKRILKWVGIAALILVVLIGALFAVGDFFNERERKARDKENSLVLVQATYGEVDGVFICTKDYPYIFTVTNNSKKTVNSVEFYVNITRKGFSGDINGYDNLVSDKILAPGESWAQCFSASTKGSYGTPLSEKDVLIEIRSKDVNFKED